MKASVKQIVDAYKLLDNTKSGTLDDTEKGKILKARKVMRPFVTEYEAFEKDCNEMHKYEDLEKDVELYNSVLNKSRQGKGNEVTEEEANGWKRVKEYDQKVRKSLHEEEIKEVEIEFDKLSEGSDVKLMSANDWTPKQLDILEIMF